MTLTVPNLNAAIVVVKGPKGELLKGSIIPPWNSFFQQFTQKPIAAQIVTVGASPFLYMPNNIGHLVIQNGTVSQITVIRGTDTILFASDTSIPRWVPVSLGDTISITYSVLPDVTFMEL